MQEGILLGRRSTNLSNSKSVFFRDVETVIKSINLGSCSGILVKIFEEDL